ncbi:bifunctional glutathionylspermidine amidase/synthase [Nitrogeniibacter mangrovi]|uniref:Bifunctional glutathionylspermidine amidase/synthase n=1 Tax=Nitrogeniibacter mangrovi TaxID=2016596 RepID=A0A6C1AY96_9RHOO|nr:bifunctional glutathionylspermidine amidase/synthase [Nitrogeniibacter mangrovi]QID16332.1 bifunctional glutathionylspermidine amidase/synthase [Nitrogeniibacter mangrovi]
MTEPTPPSARPFGAVLGLAPGDVTVHSSDYDSADPAQHPDHDSYRHFIDGEYMGYKWQCVEFARRWLYLNAGVVFDDVPMAYDIFRLRTLRRVADDARLPLQAFHNGAPRHPEPGCLLIWNEGGEFHVTGHVAIVVEVLPDRVRIAEQNVDHRSWPAGRAWARELPARIDSAGGYWIQATLPGASILGWMLQTDDATHAVALEAVDRRLFDLQAAQLPRHDQHTRPWLDTTREDEAAFAAAMGGHRLTTTNDPYRYFRLSETALDALRRATNELHAMFMHATQVVLGDDTLLARFNIPEVLWPRLRVSWERRRAQMITGRFDFSVSARGVKAYEYNADSASCHMETGRVQGKWAAHFGCTDGRDPGDELFAMLVRAWRDAGVDGVLHIMYDRDAEEAYHARFMKSAAEAAGLRCRMIRGVEGLGWNGSGEVVDPDGHPIRWVWKTWAWETALDELRDQCLEDDRVPIALGPDGGRRAPRLADVLLRRDVTVFEPLWTLIPSNKAILPVLWSIFPNHPYLLDTRFAPGEDFGADGYVVKPIVGRCGANISIYAADDTLVTETDGRFDDRAQIYQAFFELPRLDGLNVQVCTFSVDGVYGGACVRVDPSLVITTDSDLLPLRVVPDAALLAGS